MSAEQIQTDPCPRCGKMHGWHQPTALFTYNSKGNELGRRPRGLASTFRRRFCNHCGSGIATTLQPAKTAKKQEG